MKYCGAKTRSGTPCQRAAMPNGRCNLHGGKSLAGADSPTFKHGRYTKYAPPKIAEKLAAFEDADALNLFPELQLQRALIAEYMTRVTDGYRLTAADISFLSGWLAEVGRMAERITKMQNDTALTAAEVAYITARIPDVVMRFIDDPDKQRSFIAALLGIVGGVRQDTVELGAGAAGTR